MIEFKPEEILVETLRIPLEDKPLHSFQYHRFGIMVTHLPTGLTASCEEHRSQHLNKAMALNLLSNKVEDHAVEVEKDITLVMKNVDAWFATDTLPKRFYVYDARDYDLDEWDYIIYDSGSFDEPVVAFLNKEMADNYCEWINNGKT